MEITIDDSKKLSEVQDQFSKHYPYLKLEFFARPHKEDEPSPCAEEMNHELTVGQARQIHNAGLLVIHENQKVYELEKDFQDTFGLPAQVFRKVGKTWIQTTTTDDRTLKEQNKWAQMINEDTVTEPRYPDEAPGMEQE